MIIGVGTDLIDIRRIERTLARFGERFLDRVFTAAERARAEARLDRAAAYAKRYAAKEACAKALGTGFRQGVYWRDIGVLNRPSGQPILLLSGGAASREGLRVSPAAPFLPAIISTMAAARASSKIRSALSCGRASSALNSGSCHRPV